MPSFFYGERQFLLNCNLYLHFKNHLKTKHARIIRGAGNLYIYFELK
jgi:hypothetical protein